MDIQRCIEDCLDCFRICTETIAHCLQKGGRHAEANHIRLLQDCADICETAATFMMRRSDLHVRTCAVCAETCLRCAEDCDRLADDEQMRRCAEVCRRCAESCRQMSMATV
ncbi:MAG TPA: four-helix bundle copper-binding protein [Alphaproteobacteria bacterium]